MIDRPLDSALPFSAYTGRAVYLLARHLHCAASYIVSQINTFPLLGPASAFPHCKPVPGLFFLLSVKMHLAPPLRKLPLSQAGSLLISCLCDFNLSQDFHTRCSCSVGSSVPNAPLGSQACTAPRGGSPHPCPWPAPSGCHACPSSPAETSFLPSRSALFHISPLPMCLKPPSPFP